MENVLTTRAHRRIAYAVAEIRRHLEVIAEQQAALVLQQYDALPPAVLGLLANLSAAHEDMDLEAFEIEETLAWYQKRVETGADHG